MLEQEIREQPEVISRFLDREAENCSRLARELRGRFDYIVIAARGTSDNAARYAQYVFGAFNRLTVALATPSLYTLYGCPPGLQRALVIGISQSGQSPDIVSVIQEAKDQGRPTLAITNEVGSPLASASEFTLPLHAGPEKAVAATKTYTASLAALALLSSALANDTERLAQLGQLSELMSQTLQGLKPMIPRVERYRYMTQCAVLGRGFNYATAFEIALKIKELTRVVAEPYSSADFRHGPIAMIQPGFPVFVIMPRGAVLQDMREILANLQRLGAECLVASDDAVFLEQAERPMPLPPGAPEWLTPLLAVLPGQMFALNLARVKHLDPDHPKGISKVTETW
jgi:glucosamine--fructose-6-phosphate aminotransferase (isomerizing)